MPLPAAYQSLVVGFRDDDPRRFTLVVDGSVLEGFCLGECADCGHRTYGDRGAVDCVRTRDAVVACMFCNDHYRYRERISQQGMVTQL